MVTLVQLPRAFPESATEPTVRAPSSPLPPCPQPAAAEDPAADPLPRIIEHHGDALLRYLRRRTGDADEANDLLQETYIRLMKYRDAGPIQSPQALAFRVAETVVLDRNRRRATHRANAHVPFDEAQTLCVDATQEQAVTAAQELDLLVQAIAELTPKCRQVFLLVRMHGLKRQDIAERLGVSIKMVDKHLGNAMAHCRRKVEGADR